MRTKTNLIALLSFALLLFWHTTSQALPIVVDFEQFEGLDIEGLPLPSPVPEYARLFDQLLDSYGLIFTSGSPYVAIVQYYRCVPSPNKMVGGSAPDGTLTWSSEYPVTISFFKPGDTSVPACTDFVSVQGDLCGDGRPITLKAFDINGNIVASDTEPDSGSILEVSTTDKIIHQVQFFGHEDPYAEGVGIDNLRFSPPEPWNEPPTISVNIDPDTLNLKSKGKWVTCYMQQPEGHDVSDIDVDSILLEGLLEVQQSDVQDNVLMVKFDRQDLIAYIDFVLGITPPANINLVVTGEFTDGLSFESMDEIKVIDGDG